jgi:hypothetical protein
LAAHFGRRLMHAHIFERLFETTAIGETHFEHPRALAQLDFRC